VTAVREAGGLVVVDEVTTGFGRTGEWFGFQRYGVVPDIVAVGKGAGNGYPVSAATVSAETATRVDASEFRYAQSHQNDPLAAAVSAAVIGAMESEEVLVQAAERSTQLFAGLREIAAGSRAIAEIRGVGLMRAVEFANHTSAVDIQTQLREQGLLVGVHALTTMIRLYPPLVVSQRQLDEFLGALARRLDQSHGA
jgi:acetylornithine/N-succinyldiaminopimelate aminotransferase